MGTCADASLFHTLPSAEVSVQLGRFRGQEGNPRLRSRRESLKVSVSEANHAATKIANWKLAEEECCKSQSTPRKKANFVCTSCRRSRSKCAGLLTASHGQSCFHRH